MGGGGGGGFGDIPSPSKRDETVKVIRERNLEQLKEAREKNKEKRIREMVSIHHPDEMGVVFLNAGQGDATIVRFPNGEVMVVDCNVDNAPENIVKYLKNAGIGKIDYLVITHQHYDHVSGMNEITDNFEVGEVWTTKYERTPEEFNTADDYKKYRDTYINPLKKLSEKGVKIRTPSAKTETYKESGKVKMYAYSPSSGAQGKDEDIHEESIAIKVKFGKTSIFFAGDITNKGLDRIGNYYKISDTTIWHASHHGSKEGANEEALKQAKPNYTVIPVGKGNFHGHPHPEAKKIYSKHTQKKVYRTDEGSVGFRFNLKGESIEVQD
jgi:competence protein ComEC